MSQINRFPAVALVFAIATALSAPAQAESFVFHGQLEDGAAPAEGHYALKLTLYADPASMTPIAGPLEISDVAFRGGRFSVDVDFGDLPGLTEAWLDVAAKPVGDAGDYVAVDQRSPVTLKASIDCPASWALEANALTSPSVNFLGTTDDTALEIRTNNVRSLRLEPSAELDFQDNLPLTANVIAGALTNTVTAGVRGATIAGGGYTQVSSIGVSHGKNQIEANYGAIGGGSQNTVTGIAGTIGGGSLNGADGAQSSVAGGTGNTASADYSSVGGGYGNTASGKSSVVPGGSSNSAVGDYSVVPGGSGNSSSGPYSLAAGRNAQAVHQGSFVWADSQAASFSSSGANQFLAMADGGVGINTNYIPAGVEATLSNRSGGSVNVDVFLRSQGQNAGINLAMLPGAGINDPARFYIAQYNPTSGTPYVDVLKLEANGDLVVTAQAYKPGGGSWAASSDARLKRDVRPLEHALDRLLALHGVSYEYRDVDPARRPAGRQDGFIAQDVLKVFPDWVGTDSDGYYTVGSKGFEALAVEALRELRGESDTADAQQLDRIESLEAENAALRGQLEALLKRVQALETGAGPGRSGRVARN